ncbi:DUF2867 domain-containing protein [candidate division KSB1 bacterium]|nr:DUF2867 domain-containing protein [candidate division KSB1 bacterium]
MHILVTGATGYIGGRLIPLLLKKGHKIRILVRNPKQIAGRSWAKDVDIVKGSIEESDTIEKCLAGVDAAYYFIHSMYAGRDFDERDKQYALSFAKAAGNVKHVIYLGGLLPKTDKVSKHLASRAEVGEILRQHCPVTEFRAGPIIGSGSASFEMVRYLTERLPVMVAPKWILNHVQTISIKDILLYLVNALDKEPLGVVEVGSSSLSFRDMMLEYGRIRGLKRIIFPLPVLAPRLAGLWIGLITPVPNKLALPLVRGITHPVLADTAKASKFFPEIHPVSYQNAVELALQETLANAVETRWNLHFNDDVTFERIDKEGLLYEIRTLYTEYPRELVFKSFSSIGGERGWLTWNWAWKIRGIMDKLAGGPGLRRGRRDAVEIMVGEALDFWRVERIQKPEILLLRAEMKVPGTAWLLWETRPDNHGTRLVQTAIFAPTGLLGFLYWYSLYPIHKKIFNDMIRAIVNDIPNLK